MKKKTKVSKKKKKCNAPKIVSVRSHKRSGYKVKAYCRTR